MSQSTPLMRAVIANVVTPAHAERVLPCLAELADHAFALVGQQAGCDPNNVPSGKDRQARILYSVKDRVGPLPIKVILYQDVPAVQIQRVVVNLQTETVQCKGQSSLPIETRHIKHARREIKPYIQESLGILQEIWESPSHKVRHSAWQDFLKRFELSGISSVKSQDCTDSPFSEKPCPSCEMSTTLCTSCHAVICLSGDCPASRLIPFQSCSRDTYIVACLPCLQNARTIPPLGQCPECNLWFCDDELTWCPGRPKKIPNRTPSNTIREISSNVREHPAKPIVCSYCDWGQAVSECSNANCWSREGNVKYPIICQSCSPAGGVWCACEDDWICDNCKEPPMADCLKQCPQCKRAYCVRECEYIQFCVECGRTTLCDDCAEEDRSSFVGLDGPEVREVELVGACQADSCWNKFCEDCLEERKCAGCNRTYCSSCLRHDQCNSCHHPINFCKECLEKRQCAGCDQTYCNSCLRHDQCSSCLRSGDFCEECLGKRQCVGCDKTYCSSCMPSWTERCRPCGGDYGSRGGMRWRVPLMSAQGGHIWMYL